MRSQDGGHDASPTEKTRYGEGGSHTPIRAERSTPGSRTPPLGRNKTVRPRDRARSRTLRQRPLNRETLNDRLAPPVIPKRTTNRPEHTVERGEHDSQTRPEDGNARVDDEPLHREADRAEASATTTRKPVPGAHTARVVERARERDTVAESHFQSNLSCRTYWYVAGLCHTISYNVNTVLLQCAPNLFNLLLIHTTNTNTTVNITITVLNNFELKRDTVQAKNYLPSQ